MSGSLGISQRYLTGYWPDAGFLGHPQTLSVMQTEYIYPRLADRTSPKEWIEIGKPDLVQKAIATRKKMLGEPPRQIIDPVADVLIREQFKIHLKAN